MYCTTAHDHYQYSSNTIMYHVVHITRQYDTHSLTPATHVLSQLTKPLLDRWDIANGS